MPQRVSELMKAGTPTGAGTSLQRLKPLACLLVSGASLLALTCAASGQGAFGAGANGLSSTVLLNQTSGQERSGPSAAQSSGTPVILPAFGDNGLTAQQLLDSAAAPTAVAQTTGSSVTLPVPIATPVSSSEPAIPTQRRASIFVSQAQLAATSSGVTSTTLPVPTAISFAEQTTGVSLGDPDGSAAGSEVQITSTQEEGANAAAVETAVTLPVPGSTGGSQVPVLTGNGGAQLASSDLGGRSTDNYQSLVARYGGDGLAADLVPSAAPIDDPVGVDIARLLTETIDRDSRVQGLGFRLSTSDANADALRAAWVPRLDTGFRSDYNLSTGTSNALTFGARQRLFDFGRTDAALQTVTAQRILSGAQIDDMRFTIATEFLSAYLNAISATRGIAADAQEISALEQAVAANQRLADAGATSIIAARESQVDLNAAKARQTERQLSLRQANQQLSSLTQGRFSTVSKPAFESFVTRYLPSNVDICIARGLGGDSRLAVIDAQIEEAAAQLTELQLSKLPSIDIVGQTGFRPFSGTSDLGMRSETGINFAINGDLFDGGVNEAEVRAQRLTIRELQRERETTKRELELDIRRTYAAVQASGDLLANQRASLAVLSNLLADRQRQAEGGIGLIQDVLSAQVRLVQAENALTDIETEFDRERTRLVLLCGNRF